MDAYERKCAITGCNIEEILEAAHIIPYKGSHTNKLANGILLRADLHTLFDLGLITVDTNTMTVNISSKLVNTEYDFLKASKLKVKSDILQVVKLALDEHQNTFRITDYSKKK
ncbi:MAG TPA: HNH endonuclease signature motif containing protein [Pyrinomonadaceae bacterium]|nr:HNH endonuclease signature motif containing protein [Pyrinomonadaceae bacterium]